MTFVPPLGRPGVGTTKGMLQLLEAWDVNAQDS
jgi:hypothetical protein